MDKTIGFGYGALYPSLEEQAKEKGYTLLKSDKLERSRQSITWLMFQGILTNSQVDMAYKKLQKQVIDNLMIDSEGGE